jgi:hypothetical protein
MRRVLRFATIAAAGYGVRTLYKQWQAKAATARASIGHDTPTGTDPEAKWSGPGFEDKSLGQAVDADAHLVEQLVEETHGDLDAAEARFEDESAGAPALARQEHKANAEPQS